MYSVINKINVTNQSDDPLDMNNCQIYHCK
jgi:hypothetical protein